MLCLTFVLAIMQSSARQKSNTRGIHNFRDWCCHLYCTCSSAMEWYITAAGWTCRFFTYFYLESCEFAIDSRKEQRQILCKSRENCNGRPWQRLDKCSGKKAQAVHGESKLMKTDRGKTGGEQSQEHAHNFLLHQGDC
jgi:hypothetical protein